MNPVSPTYISRNIFNGLLWLLAGLLSLAACQTQDRHVTREQKPDTCNLAYDTAYAEWLGGKAKKIDSFFTARYNQRQFNGAILFADQGNVILKRVYGYANIGQKDTLTMDAAFQLASISKPLTALAVLWLEERGYLSLEDSVQHYFPKFPYDGINIRLLLSHRSGLPNYMYFSEDLWTDRSVPISNQDVVCLMETYRPNIYYIPDYRYNYCNTNYALLAAIVEKVTEMRFDDFMEQHIFEPQGMYDTFVYTKLETQAKRLSTVGYHRGRIAEDNYLNGVTGDKGIYSTVEDLFKLDQALYQGTLISRESQKKAFTAAHPELYDHDNYGLGWRINQRPDCSKIVFHSGWWKGYRTHFFRLLDKQQTIIVLSNTNRSRFIRTNELLSLME